MVRSMAHIRRVRKYFEEAGVGRKRMDNLGRRGRGKEVQHVPRVSNMKCVLGVLIMEEEEKVGGKVLKVLNIISPKCTFLWSVIINLYFF